MGKFLPDHSQWYIGVDVSRFLWILMNLLSYFITLRNVGYHCSHPLAGKCGKLYCFSVFYLFIKFSTHLCHTENQNCKNFISNTLTSNPTLLITESIIALKKSIVYPLLADSSGHRLLVVFMLRTQPIFSTLLFVKSHSK